MNTVLSPIDSEFDTAEEAAAHDRWFRAQVEAAVREADAPDAVFIPHDQVMAEMRALIEQRRKKADSKSRS
ncbi:MAG: type II toxin-antitoxin system RelB family antitoxin [Polaromonas sp.]